MKTTVELQDALYKRARKLAEKRGTTFREILETALRRLLRETKEPRRPFRLRRCTFRGKGLQPGIREGDWAAIRSLIYEDRGG